MACSWLTHGRRHDGRGEPSAGFRSPWYYEGAWAAGSLSIILSRKVDCDVSKICPFTAVHVILDQRGRRKPRARFLDRNTNRVFLYISFEDNSPFYVPGTSNLSRI